MAAGESIRLLSIPSSCQLSPQAVRDALEYFDPDGVWLAGSMDPELYAATRSAATVPVVAPNAGTEHVEHHRFAPGNGLVSATSGEDPPAGAYDVVTVQEPAVLDSIVDDLRDGTRRTGDAATLLVVPELAVEYDATTLTADLPHAADLAAVQSAVDEPVTVLAGSQPADYHHTWHLSDDGTPQEGAIGSGTVDCTTVPVHGMGATGGPGDRPLTLLTCTSQGAVAGERVGADSFGVTALQSVGRKTAETLARRGIETREALAETPVSDLADLPGVGRTSAETMHAHADVIETGEPLRLTNESLPAPRNGDPPLCLDIETDGLSPTIIWQFGVYDPLTDEYTAFTEQEAPRDPAGNVEAFCDWFFADHAERTVVTWNGNEFDYPEIARFVRQHAPHYRDAWNDVWKCDLYEWAVKRDNALLPARTNKLDDVARALGYERAEQGITGAQTAAAYQEFMRRPSDPDAEPDWERHERYCEDDCRALWHVWRAIEDAERRDTTDAETSTGGQQTGLTDF